MIQLFKNICTLLFLVLGGLSLQAQQLAYQQFRVEDGLPSNRVYDIIQDAEGFMWMGTENGLCRYDGKEFINYTVFNGLPATEILAFFKDSKQRIWFYTLNGSLGYYSKGKFYSGANTPWLKVSLNNNTLDIQEDGDGNLYFVSYYSMIRIDKNQQVHKSKLKNNFPKIARDKYQQCYLLNGLDREHIISLPNLVKVKTDPSLFSKDGLSRLYESKILVSSDKNFRQYASKCKFAFIKETNEFNWFYSLTKPLEVYSKKTGLQVATDKIVASRAFEDKYGNFWVGSVGSGVYRFQPSASGVFMADQALQGGQLSSLYIDTIERRIFVGTASGRVNVIDWHADRFEKKTSFALDTRVRKIEKGFDKNMWFLTDQNIFLRSINGLAKQNLTYSNAIKPIYIPKSIYVDNLAGSIFIGNYDGVHQITFQKNVKTTKRIFNKRTYATHKDKKGFFWFGTSDGLYRKRDITVKEIIKGEPITCIAELGDYLLAGTKGKGLLIIDADSIRRISTNTGLPSNLIRSIYIDNTNQIWISTNKGLVLLKKLENEHPEIQSFSQENGLVSEDILDCSIYKDKIYVLSRQGLAVMDIHKMKGTQTMAHIALQKIVVNDQELDAASSLVLKHDENNIQFEYAGVYFGNRDNLEYAYQLKGYHDKQQRTASNVLSLEQLPPAKYTLELFVVVNNKISENMVRYSFEIKPAWYQYKLVKLLGLLLLGFLIWWGIRYYIRKERHKNEQEKRLTQLEQMALQAQMNPHFIKNALSAIQHLMLNKDMRSANKYLTVFGDLITRLLHRSHDSFIPIREELEILELYLSIEKLRFENNFVFSFTCDDVLLDKEIPSMMLQPILENAILHGFKKKKTDTKYTLKIVIEEQGDYINCIISDNGIGIQKQQKSISRSSGIALKNIQERITLLALKFPNTTFAIDSEIDKGTSVSLHLPYHE